jgi:hypothetical protein
LVYPKGEKDYHMKIGVFSLSSLWFAALLVSALPRVSSACSVCMGDPNSREAGAMNAAIFLMLGFIFSVLALLVASAVYLYRRSQAPVPPHVQIADLIGLHSK